MPKGNSGRRKNGGILQARTIDEANKIAVNYDLAQRADFSELDISVANEILQNLLKTREDFPEAFEKLEFVGSLNGFNETKTIKYEMDRSVLASRICSTRAASLVFNDTNFNERWHDVARNNIAKGQETLFFPKGCNTLKSLIDHEIGHLIEYKHGLLFNNTINSLYDKYRGEEKPHTFRHSSKTVRINLKMAKALSGYANTNVAEFIAEAWSEYRNNPNPRPVAKKVGNEIMKCMREGAK